jgi:hypothetical protein
MRVRNAEVRSSILLPSTTVSLYNGAVQSQNRAVTNLLKTLPFASLYSRSVPDF